MRAILPRDTQPCHSKPRWTADIWTIYRSCKGAPGEFREVARELNSLHAVLHELEDEAKTPTSILNRRGSARKVELDTLLQNLSGVLKQIEDIVNQYHTLGRDQKRTWDRVRFATEDLATLRAKLSYHVNGITLFISSLSAGSLARIETILDELVKDIKEGRKEPSVISYEENEELAWSELQRDIVGDGITKQDMERYKKQIISYLKRLIEENMEIDDRSNDSPTDGLRNFQLHGEMSSEKPLPWNLRRNPSRALSDLDIMEEQSPTMSTAERSNLRPTKLLRRAKGEYTHEQHARKMKEYRRAGLNISGPENPVHITHVVYNRETGQLLGLPTEWQCMLSESGPKQNPKPQGPETL